MRYAQIRALDVANGPGIRVSLFVTGCSHKCPGCFNSAYQDFSVGKLYTEKETELIFEYLKRDNIAGITILGGEPLQNIDGLLPLMKRVRAYIDDFNLKNCDINKHKFKDIWIYSGYTFEEIMKQPSMISLIEMADVLVDGRFIQEKLNLRNRFRGSDNQRIIKIKESLVAKEAIIDDRYY